MESREEIKNFVEDIQKRDKTKEYVTEYTDYSIVLFWNEKAHKSISPGWSYKVINKK